VVTWPRPELSPIVERYLADCFANSKRPSVSALADSVGLSASSFSNLFLAQFGERPRDYLKRQQVERAKILLGTTLDLAAVCAAAGFRTEVSLYWAFRRFVGMTPKQFRISQKSTSPKAE